MYNSSITAYATVNKYIGITTKLSIGYDDNEVRTKISYYIQSLMVLVMNPGSIDECHLYVLNF